MKLERRTFLVSLYSEAVRAADPLAAMRRYVPEHPNGRTIVIGAGKAASQMASAFERLWDGALEGVVVAKHGPVEKCRHIQVLQSAHPVPDQSGIDATETLIRSLQGLNKDDLVVALISGGGSALLPAPPHGFSLADEIGLNEALLASGAPISVMNLIRKHFSRIKGGRLAALAHPARLVTFVVSDIPGDNPAFVASGPTVPSYGDAAEATRLIRDFRIDLDPRVAEYISTAIAPHPDDDIFSENEIHVVASARVSLEAAAQRARELGVSALILSDCIEGEASVVGKLHASIAREFATNSALKKPFVILSGGETTVTLPGDGCGVGGRNSEFLLAAAIDLEGAANITGFAADTDGIDGLGDNAGAFCDGQTVKRIRAAGQDARTLLMQHNTRTAFDIAGDLFIPGPTGTNVNDFRAFFIL